ncbi:MAG: asparagine synthetase B [Gemmatimonadota bacterium]
MRRRDFLRAVTVAGVAGIAQVTGMVQASGGVPAVGPARRLGPAGAGFLIPMDAGQPQPLRAYGIVYRTLRAGGSAEWLLNHRGGAFLVHHQSALDEALTRGVWTETLAESAAALETDLATGAARAMRLEVAPTIAVYAPPYAAPWDDAVRLALEYAEIPYTTVWDRDLLGPALTEVDWLHLHHEDFTGQYGKYGRSVQETDWYRAALALDAATAADLGFADAPALKAAVAAAIRGYVRQGGFVFAMCAATETLDVALAGAALDYDATFAFTGFIRETGSVGPFSTIDGHRVNTPDRLPLDTVAVESFAPLIDPVAAMLTQTHRTGFPDWYGLTTSFRADRLKPGVTVLATCGAGRLAKYLHGDLGEGTFTFLGGHDPEDFQHAIGDPPTALADHPQSPGYRLILNNVLFPAAEDERRRT